MFKFIAMIVLLLFTSPVSASDDESDPHLTTFMMRSTFKIMGQSAAGKTVFGTSFLMGEPSKKKPDWHYYVLISAKHVFDDIKSEYAMLTLRRKDGEGFSRLSHKIKVRNEGNPLWIGHPDVDVAAMRINLPEDADIRFLPTTFLADDDTLREYSVYPGDELLVFGFPYGVEANDAGFPVLRSGRIASYPLAPTASTKTFLLDFEVFSGNSGGPVMLYSANRFYGGSTHIGVVRFIMGLVSQQKGLTERFDLLDETVIRKHQLSLAVIVHASFIKEVIDELPPVE
ncbi:hypothetical protein [uncultured Desulfosarcina sp.]|uniref:hypothetical protein n=1 Tax=uncultured Desulfosarcina sp. TaxID=218289 RepID=UPI0029C7F5AA|nr:hypothetical protein [uncultured Desulfosarcina sp.]